ncbi:uncharacterized protein VNE69_02221 [Vairimorpha necatrix]|uniref:Uncharacterized protein n=1 Tax=Vairimorpha necatrix TaxID=6039 RepID=A0AAX4J9Y7_9MICR
MCLNFIILQSYIRLPTILILPNLEWLFSTSMADNPNETKVEPLKDESTKDVRNFKMLFDDKVKFFENLKISASKKMEIETNPIQYTSKNHNSKDIRTYNFQDLISKWNHP